MKNDSSVRSWNFLMGCCLLVGCFVTHQGVSQDSPEKTAATAMKASAQRALESYTKRSVNRDNYAMYGFRSFEETRRATLGESLPISFITLSDLKAYTAGNNVRQVMKDAKAVWFPVTVDNEVRAKLEMVMRDCTWTPGEFGGARTAAAFGRATANLKSKLDDISVPDQRTFTLVRIPALNSTFLLVESSQGEHLVTTTPGSPRFGLEDATVYPAQEAMAKLSSYAQRIDPMKAH